LLLKNTVEISTVFFVLSSTMQIANASPVLVGQKLCYISSLAQWRARNAKRGTPNANMYSKHDVQYAVENTKVILSPERRIETFGATNFRFYLITELMDRVNEIRIRDGRIQADRPQILTPDHLARLTLEGFGEKAHQFAEMLRAHNATLLKYGFEIRKSDVSESLIHDSVEAVVDRVRSQLPESERGSSAVIQGVDEGWEICLLKFTVDIIQQSAGGNLRDFRRKGLL
jgi:hypothetical protein